MNFFANAFICLLYIILSVLIIHIIFGFLELLTYFYNYLFNCNIIHYFKNIFSVCNKRKQTKIIPINMNKTNKYLLVKGPLGNISIGSVSNS